MSSNGKCSFFFRARVTDGHVLVAGDSTCEVGTKEALGAGRAPQGIFGQWTWDGHRLVATNDRFGYCPLFYYVTQAEIGISNSLVKLLANGAPGELDYDALAVYVRLGFFLRERTPFRAIRVLPPNGRLEWSNGRADVTGELTLTMPQRVSPAQAVEGYVHLFRQAMEQRAPAGTIDVFPLSGGRDSRQILFELYRMGRAPLVCATMGAAETADVKAAAQVAAALNIPHRVIMPRDSWVEYELRKNVTAHFSTAEHTWILPLADHLSSVGNEWYDGLGIGIFTRSDLLRPKVAAMYKQGQYLDFAQWLFTRTVAAPQQCFRGLGGALTWLARSEESAVQQLAEELERHTEAANPLASFNFWNWGRRGIALSPCVIGRGTVRLPFLDHDLFDFVSSLPLELVLEHEPQTQAIKAAFPQFADVPFDKYFEAQTSNSKGPRRRIRRRIENDVGIVKILTRLKPAYLSVAARLRYAGGADGQRVVPLLLYLAQLESCGGRVGAEEALRLAEAA